MFPVYTRRPYTAGQDALLDKKNTALFQICSVEYLKNEK